MPELERLVLGLPEAFGSLLKLDFNELEGSMNLLLKALNSIQISHEAMRKENLLMAKEIETLKESVKYAQDSSALKVQLEDMLVDLKNTMKKVDAHSKRFVTVETTVGTKADETRVVGIENVQKHQSENIQENAIGIVRVEETLRRSIDSLSDNLFRFKDSTNGKVHEVQSNMGNVQLQFTSVRGEMEKSIGDIRRANLRLDHLDEEVTRHNAVLDELTSNLSNTKITMDNRLALKADGYLLDAKTDLTYTEQLYETISSKLGSQVRKNSESIGGIKSDIASMQQFMLQEVDAAGFYRCLSCSRLQPTEILTNSSPGNALKKHVPVNPVTTAYSTAELRPVSMQGGDGKYYKGRQEVVAFVPTTLSEKPIPRPLTPKEGTAAGDGSTTPHWQSSQSPGRVSINRPKRPTSAQPKHRSPSAS